MNLGDAQLRAQSELQPGESLYWTGVPDPRRAAVVTLPAALFGIPFAGFALFWITMAYRGTQSMSKSANNGFTSAFNFFPLFGTPFLLIGLGIVLAPLWAYLKSLNTVYAITNQRVLIISGTNTRSVKSLTPLDIVSVDHRERADGTGDVLIRTTSAQARPTNTGQAFNLNASVSASGTVGLFGVPNVKDVARQVMNLHTQRTAA